MFCYVLMKQNNVMNFLLALPPFLCERFIVGSLRTTVTKVTVIYLAFLVAMLITEM